MLSLPSKAFRVNAAIALVALYAFCILAPATALALSGNPTLAHCLTEGHVGVHVHGDNTHVHAGGVAHQHHDHGTVHQHHDDGASQKSSGDDGKGSVASCCGLFSVVAIFGEPGLQLGASTHVSAFVPAAREWLTGRGPERLYRPPISPLSL